jgi:hypothetical protein
MMSDRSTAILYHGADTAALVIRPKDLGLPLRVICMAQAKVASLYIKGFVQSAGEVSPVFQRKLQDVLDEHGLDAVSNNGFYSYKTFTRAVEDIENEIGDKTLRQAGATMVEVDDQIAASTSLEEGLQTLKQQNEAAFQKFAVDEVGTYDWERVSDAEVRVATVGGYQNPEPLAEGIISGVADVATDGSPIVKTTDPKPDEVHAFLVTF